MIYDDLGDFLSRGAAVLTKGPVAIILAEDPVELDSTIVHHQQLGFRQVLVLASPRIDLPAELEGTIHRIAYDIHRDGAAPAAVNAIIAKAKGTWLFYCYNAEYLFFPFCEHRSIGEMLAFHAEERRDAMLTYVIDLYASDLAEHPNAVSLEDAHFDRAGYYALAREDADNHYHPRDRQLDFFGGLRWRYEEHIPWERRRLDRMALFRACEGLRLRTDHTLNEEEMNTYACPWHHNLTAAICSFRTAKALTFNPGSKFDIETFTWHNSTKFEWQSRQLLDLGFMEPGQWF